MEWSQDEVWIDLGHGALWLQPAQLEHIQFSDREIVEGDRIVGWEQPSPEIAEAFPRARPGFRIEQVKRTGPMNQRATDHVFSTPFGDRWMFKLVED